MESGGGTPTCTARMEELKQSEENTGRYLPASAYREISAIDTHIQSIQERKLYIKIRDNSVLFIERK